MEDKEESMLLLGVLTIGYLLVPPPEKWDRVRAPYAPLLRHFCQNVQTPKGHLLPNTVFKER